MNFAISGKPLTHDPQFSEDEYPTLPIAFDAPTVPDGHPIPRIPKAPKPFSDADSASLVNHMTITQAIQGNQLSTIEKNITDLSGKLDRFISLVSEWKSETDRLVRRSSFEKLTLE